MRKNKSIKVQPCYPKLFLGPKEVSKFHADWSITVGARGTLTSKFTDFLINRAILTIDLHVIRFETETQ